MIYDLVGIGAGPSNLSLASLSAKKLRSRFIERKAEPSWHKGMEFHFSDLQVSFIKDLVTLADPTNEYSFLNYLHTSQKLYHFLNAKFDSVSRQEYADYLAWVSKKLNNILMNESVLSVDYDGDFVIETDRRLLRSRNISVGVGKVQHVPTFAKHHLDNSNFPVSQYKFNDHVLSGRNVLLIGGGQSGAEAFYDLISRSGTRAVKSVNWISRRNNFSPIDDTPFTNDLYMPCHIDYLKNFSSEKKKAYVQRNILTSDGISEKTLKDIYQLLYRHKFIDRSPLQCKLLPGRNVQGLKKSGTKWQASVCHVEFNVDELYEADVIIWATGFQDGPKEFLRPIDHLMEKDGDEYRVDDYYSVVWEGPKDRNIFMLNSVRFQKGLSDPNFSLMAWRSKRVIDRIEKREIEVPLNKSLVEWNPILELEAST